MAAPMRRFFVNNASRYILVCQKCSKAMLKSVTKRNIFLASFSTFTVQNVTPLDIEIEKNKKSETGSSTISDALLSATLIKNGTVWSVDAATAVLTQTTTAIVDIEKEYVEAVYKLTDMLTYRLSIFNKPNEEDVVWDLILERRSQLNEVKRRREELDLLLSSVIKLMESAAEVAFTAGADYASTCAGERLYSSQREINNLKKLTKDAEMELNEVEVKIIEETTKHNEKQEQQKKKAQQEFEKQNKETENEKTEKD